MTVREQDRPLYAVAQTFARRCWIGDDSLLWPGQPTWTAEDVSDFRRRVIDAPFLGAEPFDDKLDRQLAGAPGALWRMVADMNVLYYLPSTTIRPETKRRNIDAAAQRSGEAVIAPVDPEILRLGFCGTGQQYHLKFKQIWTLCLIAQAFKALPTAERQAVVEDADRLQALIDATEGQAPQGGWARDIRHALLYLLFPDRYERIISGADKKAIVAHFSERVSQPLPGDTDRAVRLIRETLSGQLQIDPLAFDFYQPEVRGLWKDPAKPEPVGPAVNLQPKSIPQPPPPAGAPTPPPTVPLPAGLASTLTQTRNVILYGPPGTGKTYWANQASAWLVKDQMKAPAPDSARIQEAIDGLPMYDIIALGLYQAGQVSLAVPDLHRTPVVSTRFRLQPVTHPNNTLWSNLQSHTDPDSQAVKVTLRVAPYLFDKDPDSRWRLTPAGRAYVENDLSDSLAVLMARATATVEDFTFWTTFHQAYSYEDFMEGLRPESNKETAALSYPIRPGVFKEICGRATLNPTQTYVLIIDEINRGNIARVFGELITLLEDDKRGVARMKLPYSGDAFTVPPNLYVIGTMNSSDRSIALLDVALRRRFAFVELEPDPGLLDGLRVTAGDQTLDLAGLLRGLNRQITAHLGRDHAIGHSYFLPLAGLTGDAAIARLSHVWNHQLLPLLQEYFYTQPELLQDILAPFRVEGESPTTAGQADGEDLIAALNEMANQI